MVSILSETIYKCLSSAYSTNRYNLPLYWLSTAFGTAGWNVASSLIAVGLVRIP